MKKIASIFITVLVLVFAFHQTAFTKADSKGEDVPMGVKVELKVLREIVKAHENDDGSTVLNLFLDKKTGTVEARGITLDVEPNDTITN
jgi:hypothetical protein